MAQGTRLREVAEGSVDSIEAATQPQRSEAVAQQLINAATAMLMQGIKALSQRALVALGNLVGLVFVAAVFALAWRVAADPSPWQLGELGLYSAFILVALRLLR